MQPMMVVFTRDSHPADHCSFQEHGGDWPVHCVVNTPGWEFHREISASSHHLIDKATSSAADTYSGFEETSLAELLQQHHIKRVLIAGLATDYCVKATALEAARSGLETWVLTDAIAAVELQPGDEQRALVAMRQAGVNLSDTGQILTILGEHRSGTALILVDLQRDFFSGGALAVPNAERILRPLQQLLAQVAPQ